MNYKIIFTFLIICFSYVSIISQTEQNINYGGNVIHLKIFGEGNPVLIINGGPGMNSNGFESLAKVIGISNKAIIYDQRGTGKSTIRNIDRTTITLDSMIYDIEKIREHLKIKEWILLGHSFGGMLASYYTTKFPERVNGLILSTSGGIDLEGLSKLKIADRLTKTEKDSLRYWRRKISEGDTTYFAKLHRAKFLASAYLYDKTFVNNVAERLTQTNFKINRLVLQNMKNIKFDCKDELNNFSKPVLILQGEHDIIDKKVAEKEHAVFPNSKLIFIKNCSHYGWLEQPEIYFRVVNNFINSLE